MGFSDDCLSYIYDKNDGYCWYCSKKLSFSNYGLLGERGAWEVDHSVPKSKGGTDYLRNLVPACIGCNRQKGTRMGRAVRASSNYSERSTTLSLGEVLVGAGAIIGAAYLVYHFSRPRQQ